MPTYPQSIVALLLLFLSCKSVAAECEAITDTKKLAEIRQDAAMFGNYANGWLFAKAGSMLCLPIEESDALRCTSEGEALLVSMAKDRSLKGGVAIQTDEYQEFIVYADGLFECVDTLAGAEELEKRKAGPVDVCDIHSDLTDIYQKLEQSILHTQIAGAKLYLHHGNIECKSEGDNRLVCLTADEAEVIWDADGSPLRAIKTFGVEDVEMSFYASGDLGCGAVSELERYRN